ncbi:MAG: single-stranded DNA-binding protein [Armatimonadota bacterium]
MIQVTAIGNLTRDPIVKTTENGVKYALFTIASDVYLKDNEKRTDFIDCIAYRGTAEFVEKHLKQGKAVAVVGELSSFVQDKDGVKTTKWNIKADKCTFVPASGRDLNSVIPSAEPAQTASESDDDDMNPWGI